MKLHELPERYQAEARSQIAKEEANKRVRQFVSRLRAKKPEPNQRSQSENRGMEPSEEGARYCVVICIFRERLLDGRDNAPAALKALTDHITRALGFTNDEGEHLTWEYHQHTTHGQTGTQVIITRL